MAINRVDYPADLTSQSDFSDHSELIETRFMDQSAAPIQVRDGVIPRGVVLQIGGVVYRADSDETISGTETNYVKVTPDGSTATAEYVTDLTGVSWDSQYNGYYDSNSNLYLFDEATARADGEIPNERGRYVEKDDSGNVNIAGNFPLSRMEVFESSGTFNAPNGVSRVKVTVVGAGGGGGAAEGFLEPGENGGESSFEGISATGGVGGLVGGSRGGQPSWGGIGSNGSINMRGSPGNMGVYFSDISKLAGFGEGGSSFFGGGAPTRFPDIDADFISGLNGSAYGGGGSGGCSEEGGQLRSSGGGGGGGCAIGFVNVTSGNSYSVTVGSGGSGGDGPDAAGGDGADGVVVIEY